MSAVLTEQSWIDVREAAPMFGMTAGAIKNAILENRFACPTYKLGKRHVIDRDVLEAFFSDHKAAGIKRLHEPKEKAARRRPK